MTCVPTYPNSTEGRVDNLNFANDTIQVPSNSYIICPTGNILSPEPLLMTITRTIFQQIIYYDINLGTNFNYKYVWNGKDGLMNVGGQINGANRRPVTISNINNISRYTSTIVLGDPSILGYNDVNHLPWKNEDTYNITFTNINLGSAEIVSVNFIRFNNFQKTANLTPIRILNITQDQILVPIINIAGQTLIDASDIGNVIFNIQDRYQYYNYNKKLLIKTNNSCENFINVEDLKITVFNKACPKIVSVVRGKGITLFNKLTYIFKKLGEDEIGSNFIAFYPNIFLYAMLKYILSRILYGKFDVNFLLGKYNDKFLRDLGNSRFCGILPQFEDPNSIIYNYNKYFKYT